MRRPVKPFVTEYRGGVRRQGPPGQKSDPLKAEPDGEETRAAESRAWPQGAAPEDGYEAALRAADALFSTGRAAASADDSAPGAVPDEAQPGAGRVLRVLDEPPPPEMARLEAEFAPKRRGRKPGSKNKPKMAAVPALIDGAPSETRGVPSAETRAALTPAALPHRTNAVPMAALSGGPNAPRGERYAWVRTRLKPGEQWKRRLPKVAW